ncbi:unnamed protein product [Meloidogyne enterolobii]|uniref:Uncharacterized protein n=1 Tax=Meloidogyne enterolobii TaxID=390850 RepID=A0ACB1A0R7_MELEN
MKLVSFLIVLIFNLILWESVNTTPIRKRLGKPAEKDYSATELLNDGAESSVNPQTQKYKETLKPKLKITNKDRNNEKDKKFNRSEYNKEYYQKNKEYLKNYKKQNKEKINELNRNYYQRNKDSIIKKKLQYMKIHQHKNKESIQKYKKMYYQNNKRKLNEYQRKYRQNKKNVQSDYNEGTSFVNPKTGDFTNKGKLSIVCEENFEERNLLNEGEGESNDAENEKNQLEVEEPNKILEDDRNSVNSNNNMHSFDLNEIPDDEKCEDGGKLRIFYMLK